jgi:protease-4
MGSDTIGAAFRAAVKDERVKAIVFRVDSPGGSAVASDAIWREVVLARRAGKPVVVSMGNVAASGGYYVSMAADTIIAQPGTLTGSIGVVVGKAVVSGLLDRVGIGLGAVADGDHARMLSATKDFSDSEWERVNASLDRIYDDFTAKVAEGRDLPRERVHELARGRVWTGADAKANGLVDELGGIDAALDLARKKAGLASDAPIRVYPHTSPLERLRPPESSEDRTAASARFDGWGSLGGLAARLGLPSAGPLTLPGTWEIR